MAAVSPAGPLPMISIRVVCVVMFFKDSRASIQRLRWRLNGGGSSPVATVLDLLAP